MSLPARRRLAGALGEHAARSGKDLPLAPGWGMMPVDRNPP